MGHDELGHVIYELSFTQVDRAIAILKALGYTTVEFTSGAGESPYEKLYGLSSTAGRPLPIVVKLIDAPKTSLMDTDPSTRPAPGQMAMPMAPAFGGAKREAVPDIGGTFLHQSTAGEPQQRLLILYDRSDPVAMERLAEVLREEIDVPARQVVISALVLEVNTDKTRELGVQFSGGNGKTTYSNVENQNGDQQPFTFAFDSATPKGPFEFNLKLKALVDSGEAEVLSNPSVLVLDGRQARIQVGQQVPVVNSTSTAAGITSSVEYFPVGIVLNLRPRISKDGSEVTMQVETIVSAVASQATTTASVFFAPTVDNRQVQSFVRVADNTPFIIGGLISTISNERHEGVPFLSKLPIIGELFRNRPKNHRRTEVIVTITPHIMKG
jgi:type II secretory pathway component GspD/PulD (secretin)